MKYTLLLIFMGVFSMFKAQINLDFAINTNAYTGSNDPYYHNYGNRVRIDDENNIITIGLFTGTKDFDPSNNSTYFLTGASGGLSTLFIQKLSSSGNLIFAKMIELGAFQGSYTHTDEENYLDLEIGSNNEIFISGQFKGTRDFDPGTGISSLTSVCAISPSQCYNDCDQFILKLNSSGDFNWVRQIETSEKYLTNGFWTGFRSNYGITIDDNNSIYILSRGVNAIPNTWVQSQIDNKFRVLKFDNSGNFFGQKVFNNFFEVNHFSYQNGKIVYSGDFVSNSSNGVNIEGFQLYSTYMGGVNDGDDLCMVVSDTLGIVENAFVVGGGQGRMFTTDSHTILPNGDVVIVGHTYQTSGGGGSTIDWDPTSGQFITTHSSGLSNSFDFIVSYSNTGNLNWLNIYPLGNGIYPGIHSISSDNFSNIYVLGDFTGNVDFNLGGGTSNLISINKDVFLLKLQSNANFVYAYGFNGTGMQIGNELDVKNCDVAFVGTINQNSMNFSTTGTTNLMGPSSYLAKYSCCQIPVDINLSGDTLTCVNDQLTLSVNQPNTTFSWYNGNTLVGNSSTLLVSSPGTFTLNAINSLGCFGQDQVTIVADTTEPILDYNLTDSVLTCQNPLITGTLNSPSGNSVSWTLNNTVISTTTSSQINIPGNLVISTTGLNGCTNTDSILITSTVTYPSIDFSVLDTLCAGQNLVLTASGNGQINWNPDLPNGSIVYPTVSQFYTANIIDSLGCENADSVYVNVIQGPNLAVTSDTVCNGESSNLTVTSALGTSIYWQTGQTTANISLTTNQDTSIYVFGILNGCYSDTLFANITVLPNSTVEIEVNGDSVLCVGGVVNLVSSQINGNSWSTGQSSQTISISQPQWVILSNTNPNGCISQDSINITTSGFPCLEIIDVFSPNDDGINDYWEIPGIEAYPKAEVSIFNRWGQLLFFSVGYSTPWNGKFNNEPLPTGDYFYIIDLGNGTKFNGSMTLKK